MAMIIKDGPGNQLSITIVDARKRREFLKGENFLLRALGVYWLVMKIDKIRKRNKGA